MLRHRFTSISEETRTSQKDILWDYIRETLFIIPENDAESMRASAILRALKVPYLHASTQKWGATLDKEWDKIDKSTLSKIRRVSVLEIPGLAKCKGDPIQSEENIKNMGLMLDIIDHHYYGWVDRHNSKSSLEQLCERIGWKMDKTDTALSVNDRSYIPGLKKMGLTNEEIREIRYFDLLCQGNSATNKKKKFRQAQKKMKELTRYDRENLWVMNCLTAHSPLIIQELCLLSPDGKSNILEIRASKIGFSGEPIVVDRLLALDIEAAGFGSGYISYGGGDDNQSKFWGLKTKSKEIRIPDNLKDMILKTILEVLSSSIKV
ncbi:MAG: hypothetical protein HQK54_18510 [Oligoflexales bacterium]|nr:hypothetical protein [Oligoflexales bacterium]